MATLAARSLETAPWAESPAAGAADWWSISRRDIEFFNLDPLQVAIQIKVTNTSTHPSPPATAVVQAAPFGAFVPWQPLIDLPIPPLAPGEVRFLRARAVAYRPQPLGSPDRVPPRRVLTALGFAGDSPREQARETAEAKPGASNLPADLMQILGQEIPHWAGNINVLVGTRDVERHLARALRIYPGRVNMAWFFVGSGGRDAYAFRLQGTRTDWDARLFDMTDRRSLVVQVEEAPQIAPDQWIPSEGTRMMLLALRPPTDCRAGSVAVWVTQRSTGRTAVVEFSLDATAAGRGCYVV